jgi:hypothetical protein
VNPAAPAGTMIGAVDANGNPLQVANPSGAPPIPANNGGIQNQPNPTSGFQSPVQTPPVPPQQTSAQAAANAMAQAAAAVAPAPGGGGQGYPDGSGDPACAYLCNDCDAEPGCGMQPGCDFPCVEGTPSTGSYNEMTS